MYQEFEKKEYIDQLRQKAEEAATLDLGETADQFTQDDVKKIIQDLRVYQIELEMQNDELFRAKQLLENAKNEFFDLYHKAPIGYATINSTGFITQANQTLEDFFVAERDIINKPIVELFHEDDQLEFRGRFRAFFNKPEKKELHARLVNHTGEVHVALTGRRSYIGDSEKKVEPSLLVAFADITQIKKTELELRLAAKIFDTSIEGKIVRVNKAFTIVTGYSEAEILGQSPAILQSGKHHSDFYNNMWQSLKDIGYWQGEIVNMRKNKETYVEWLSISSIRNANSEVTLYVGIFSDITEKKLNTQQMQKLAYYDILTNLPNRTLFYDRLKQALVRAKRNDTCLAVLFIDLDNFKELNDTHGHSAGDELLRQTGDKLKETIRQTDTLARIGGDEFTLILSDIASPEQAIEEAKKVADKILESLGKKFDLGNVTHSVSASIGIAIYPQDGSVISELVKHADTAMYQAKAAGKGCYHFFSQQIFEAQKEKTQLTNDLKTALDNHEFILYYQPQSRMDNGKIVGFEALIRWQHPSNGLLPPGFFIQLAEEVGLINEIGLWVLDEAMGQLKKWRSEGHMDWTVSINLSVEQIRDYMLPVQIKNLLDKHDVPSHMIELEITETAMMKDTLESSEALKKIKALGFKISLDDFGTGYSSMTYIKHFPIDVIKIDRSFVRDIFDSLEDKSIVMASLSLAKNLDVRTVAEGVENQKQKEFLQNNNCDILQGYLLSKPIPVSEIDAFIQSYEKTI